MVKRLVIASFLIAIAVVIACKIAGPPAPMLAPQMKFDLEAGALRYFIENSHPRTGLVRDNAQNFSVTPASNRQCSMAATGFGLAVIANASSRGLVESKFARDYALKVLKFSRDHVARRKGWFLHFVDWETGERFGRSEYSTIDSALFLAGALYAAKILEDREISQIAQQLYVEMDFHDLLTDGGTKPDKKILSMAYMVEENAYSDNQWHMYAEQMILLLLGLGHPTHPLPIEVWQAWERPVSDLPSGEKVMGVYGSLFVHQYSQLFIDFRAFDDGHLNYFANSTIASRYNRSLAQNDKQYKTFQAGFWGLSAGAAPNHGYEAWNPTKHVGIACIDCAIGSAMFLPEVVFKDAAAWRAGPYRKKIWGRYGFTDSLDLDGGWISDLVYGITVGPAFLSLANLDPETSIWKTFMEIPEIRTALNRAAATNPTDARKPDSAK